MRIGGIIRFFTVCFACFSILLYNAADIFSAEKTPIKEAEKESAFIEEEEKEEAVSTPEKQEEKPVENTSSVAVTASAVKGKIIEKYVSPYTAKLSYNNVYVKNSSGLSVDIKPLLEGSLSFKIKKNEEPQVLIMHTHTTETFMDKDTDVYTENFNSRNTDNSKNMVKIGETVAKKLNDAGIKTLHDKTQHDYPQYTGSYTRSAKTVSSYLKQYPSIKIVLDLHRDAISSGDSDKVKLATKINGKKAAQVMLVMGSQSGSVTNFPDWQENLKLALKLQQVLEVKYPTLARPLSLVSKNYNQSLTKGSLLLEFGTDANSLDEAVYSAELVGEALVSLLNTEG